MDMNAFNETRFFSFLNFLYEQLSNIFTNFYFYDFCYNNKRNIDLHEDKVRNNLTTYLIGTSGSKIITDHARLPDEHTFRLKLLLDSRYCMKKIIRDNEVRDSERGAQRTNEKVNN